MAISDQMPEQLWTPQHAGHTPMDEYRLHVNNKYQQHLQSTTALQQWSVRSPHDFWCDLYGYLGFIPPLPPGTTKAFDDTVSMASNPTWFPGLRFNYAENALFANPDENALALIGVREDTDLSTSNGELLTWKQFREAVRVAASALRRSGVKLGDRVAALVATSVPAMVLFHASASIGAIFTCISPDLGLEGCVSRLQQVTPTILFADSHTLYKGRTVSTLAKISSIVARLGSSNRPLVYIVPLADERCDFESIDHFMKKADDADELTFERVAFTHPLMICYSSGTSDSLPSSRTPKVVYVCC
jgi:acetoacetyl-CoA synthetase